MDFVEVLASRVEERQVAVVYLLSSGDASSDSSALVKSTGICGLLHWARLHLYRFVNHLLRLWNPKSQDCDQVVPVASEVVQFLGWWLN